MLEKTLTTFHASNVLLLQQYRERRFTKYSKLISCLLVAKQNNELLKINLVLLGLCHYLKQMPHLFKLLDMDKDMDMDEVEVEDVVTVKVVVDIILLIVVVLKVKRTTQTTRSGIIQRHNLKRK